MPNAIFYFLQKLKINESTKEENNAYFDTSLPMTPKRDELRYHKKNVATHKATEFNYQPEVHKNLRGIGTICAT